MKEYRDRNWLEKKYVDELLSTYEIADLCGVSQRTICYWMEKHNIETRELWNSIRVRKGKMESNEDNDEFVFTSEK